MNTAKTKEVSENVIPHHYSLTLSLDLEAPEFQGVAEITVLSVEATSDIRLHSKGLMVRRVGLRSSEDPLDTRQCSFDYDVDQDLLVISADSALSEGNEYVLSIEYSAAYNPRQSGIYISARTDSSGKTRRILSTHFEPTSARTAFPCWDLPMFKASFELHVETDRSLSVYSNAPHAECQKITNGKTIWHFKPTVPISSYLVAIVIGEFKSTEPVMVDNTGVSIVMEDFRAESDADLALDVAARSLKYFSDILEMKFPQSKIDHIGVPDQYGGGMENFGCVIYNQNYLLADPKASLRVRQDIARIIVHETAHQWFGNIVTTNAWGTVWLNEAFATYFEAVASDALFAEWDEWAYFAQGLVLAKEVDSLNSTRAIDSPVASEEDSTGMFDPLTYEKGAAVLHGLRTALGWDEFINGVRRYLSRNKYATTESSSVWEAFDDGGRTESFLTSWLNQKGLPLIHVSTGHDGRTLTLAQRKFSYGAQTPLDEEALWSIPVALRASVEGEVVHQRLLMDQREVTLELDGDIDWVLLNEGGCGFYRSEYSTQMHEKLLPHLPTKLSSAELITYLSDFWASVLSGAHSVTDMCLLLGAVGVDVKIEVLNVILKIIEDIKRVWPVAQLSEFRDFVWSLIEPSWRSFDWEKAISDEAAERISALIRAAGVVAGAPQIVDELLVRWDSELAIPTELRGAVLMTVGAHGGNHRWTLLYEELRETEDSHLQNDLLKALALRVEPEAAEQLLRLSLDRDAVSVRQAAYLIRDVMAANPSPRAWTWVEDHWSDILQRIDVMMLFRAIESMQIVTNRDLASRIEKWAGEANIPIGAARVAQQLERMNQFVALSERTLLTSGAES